ncbi:MAG: ring-1,2-phenylacetyl-CoA epoxidase subunit PaaD [Gammaproteobacteria bacterium]|jgi:ring-1,2-phenylacetyl-CoA epoxidase subunit PaaD
MTAAPCRVTIDDVLGVLNGVCDPEIPSLTIADLGILREVYLHDGNFVVVITPTYSGCPAMQTIEDDIGIELAAVGIDNFLVETRLAPAWTTDWLSESGRNKLLEVGIAPPAETTSDKRAISRTSPLIIACPQCQSVNTERISEFGSTACKALYRCVDCREPFDYFKCI